MPVPFTSELGPYKQILEINARRGAPGAVVVEVERDARYASGFGPFGGDEEGLGVAGGRVRGEGEGGAESLFGGEDFVQGVFVGGELVD